MKRVLITGMSATGKSSLISKLAGLGYKAVDADVGGWSEWVEVDGNPTGTKEGWDWVWQERRIQDLLSVQDTDVLFLAGCAKNMGKFYPQFDHIVLLSAPSEVIVGRLEKRTNNPYGKRPEEVAQVLANTSEVEPILRRVAHHEVDTSASLDTVVTQVLRLVGVDA